MASHSKKSVLQVLQIFTDLQVASGVEKEIAWLEITMNDIGGVNVFQSSQNLIQEVANMIIAKMLSLQEFVQIRFHQILNNQTENKMSG